MAPLRFSSIQTLFLAICVFYNDYEFFYLLDNLFSIGFHSTIFSSFADTILEWILVWKRGKKYSDNGSVNR